MRSASSREPPNLALLVSGNPYTREAHITDEVNITHEVHITFRMSGTHRSKKPNARALGFFERCVPLARNVMRTSCVMFASQVMCASRVRMRNTSHHCDQREQHHCGEAITSLRLAATSLFPFPPPNPWTDSN